MLKDKTEQEKEFIMSKKTGGKQTPAALDSVLAQIRKEFGEGAIMRMGDPEMTAKAVPAISTGSFSLDIALGVGGLPRAVLLRYSD